VNIKYTAVWKLIEFDGHDLAMHKIVFSAASTPTRPVKSSAFVQRNGVYIYAGVPNKKNHIFDDRLITWIAAPELSIKRLVEYVTPLEAREIIAIHKMNRDHLLRVIRKEAS
jgi:hypothetical protein